MAESTLLRVARQVRLTGSEGPGIRHAFWVQGCSIRCPGCCNPEMFVATGGETFDVHALANEILATRTDELEGVTFLGGEPFEQAAPLAELGALLSRAGLSVMVFTGHVLEKLVEEAEPARLALIAVADVIADGPYVAGEPGSRWRWLGSQNQRMHFLTDRYTESDPRFVAPNTVDIRIERRSIAISGWAPAAKAIGERAARGKR